MSADAAARQASPSHRSHIIEDQSALTDVVVDAMSGAPDARLREVMAAFVRHMHAFAREV